MDSKVGAQAKLEGKEPRPRKRMKAEERRTQLIQVAIKLFSERGFNGTSTREIAAAAQVTEALIFRYFSSKDELYSAILEYKAAESRTEDWLETLKALAYDRDDVALIRSLVTQILEGYRRDPDFQRLMFYSALEGHEMSKIFNEKQGFPIFEFLKDYVVLRQKEGAFREGDPGAIVFSLVGAPVYYSTIRWLQNVDLLQVPDKDIADLFVKVLVAGLRKDPSPEP